MNKEQFEKLIRAAGCDENTIRFGLNAFEMGMEHMRDDLSKKIAELPFGDTAASFSIWVKELS